MRLEPASFAQVRYARDGRRVNIDADVGEVATRLREIDPKLGLQWNEKGDFYMVVEYVEKPEGEEERLIFTAQECDQRIVKRMEEIANPSYDFMAEVEAMDRQADRDKDHRFHEQTGEAAERMAHALRKDLGATNKAFVGKDLNGGTD